MNHKEMVTCFEKMRELLCMKETQRAYDAKKWRECVNLWLGIFAHEPFSHVWAGVRMYIHHGGKYWPYPGEIADMMPSSVYIDDDSLKNLTYQTRAQARVEAERYEKMHRLNPWKY